MIQSMTGFARVDANIAKGTLSWEIRSVNHRYLDTKLKLPETCRALEPEFLSVIKNHFTRGRLDCVLRINLDEHNDDAVTVCESKVLEFKRLYQQVDQLLDNKSSPRTLDAMKWPDVITKPELSIDAIKPDCIRILSQVCEQLVEQRQQEGQKLQQFITEKLNNIAKLVNLVSQDAEQLVNQLKLKLSNLQETHKIQLDSNRLEQEVVLLANKADVTEEYERLESHITKINAILKKGGAVGKQLDFVLQEMNREANTLAAKSNSAELSHHAVDIKVNIEQIREQIQNLE